MILRDKNATVLGNCMISDTASFTFLGRRKSLFKRTIRAEFVKSEAGENNDILEGSSTRILLRSAFLGAYYAHLRGGQASHAWFGRRTIFGPRAGEVAADRSSSGRDDNLHSGCRR